MPRAASGRGRSSQPARATDADEPLFELGYVRELLGFPWRSVKRHPGLAIGMFLLVSVGAGLATLVLPRHYMVETKLVADKNNVMPALGNPRRAVPAESDAPTRLAVEAVMRRDNLVEIVRETNLMAVQSKLRSPLGLVFSNLVNRIAPRKQSTDEQLKMVVGLLRNRMWVRPTAEGTVTIGVDWPEPQSAFRLVQSAQQNFMEQRYASEIAMIGESISILEGHVATAQQSMQQALGELKAARPEVARVAAAQPAAAAAPRRPASLAAQSELASLQSTLSSKQRLIADLESARTQRLVAAQTHLAELRRTYGPAHPEIAASEESVRALQVDSPQLLALKADESALMTRVTSLAGTVEANAPPAPAPSVDASVARAAIDRLARARNDSADSPQTAYAQSRLKMATNDYEDLLARLEDAKIELETARAGFKYRFSVISPAELPKKPIKPKVPLLLGGGMLVGCMLALFAATFLDVVSGRVLESWQVTRKLGLPILATVPSRK